MTPSTLFKTLEIRGKPRNTAQCCARDPSADGHDNIADGPFLRVVAHYLSILGTLMRVYFRHTYAFVGNDDLCRWLYIMSRMIRILA